MQYELPKQVQETTQNLKFISKYTFFKKAHYFPNELNVICSKPGDTLRPACIGSLELTAQIYSQLCV